MLMAMPRLASGPRALLAEGAMTIREIIEMDKAHDDRGKVGEDGAMNSHYRLAQTLVSIARLTGAASYAALAILLIMLALWLALLFGQGWLLDGLALLLGWSGAATGVKAAELLLSARPPQQAAQQQGSQPPQQGYGSTRRYRDRGGRPGSAGDRRIRPHRS